VRFRERPSFVEQTIINTAKIDGHSVIIGLPLDPAGGGAYIKALQKQLSELGFTCKLIRPNKGKVARFAPFSAVAEGGFVKVVKAPWNNDYHTELENFDGSNKFKDDQVDASSDCFTLLNQGFELPTAFNLPDLSSMANTNKSVSLFNDGPPTTYSGPLQALY
jgi:predicted phage terminase large subunit-like protein